MELSDYEGLDFMSVIKIEEFLRLLTGNNPRAVMEEFLRLLMGNYPRAVKEEFRRLLMETYYRESLAEEFCRMLMIEALRIKLNDPYLSEEVDVLHRMLMELNKNSVAYEEMSLYISEVIVTENIRKNQLLEKLKLFIFLLAFLLHSGNDDYKHLARPERGRINCITVYLLGNDGAHSYNGNGILLATTRRYTRLTNEDLFDEIRPANIPLHVLQRQPTDKEIARLSGKIGHEYRQLGFELGLKPAQLDHLIMDYQFTAHRIERMLLIWRDDIEGNATVEILVKAMGMHGINPEIVYQSLERA